MVAPPRPAEEWRFDPDPPASRGIGVERAFQFPIRLNIVTKKAAI
jgi:hypothetical protein